MDGLRQAFIGAGSNLGDRAATLRGARERLRAIAGVSALDASPVYETEPVGVTDQPPFLNQVFGIETTLTPEALLAGCQRIEAEFGRVRTRRWGPRTLDLDVLWFEGETRSVPDLVIPHPRMFERAFVIIPLRELLDNERFRTAAWDDIRRRLEAADVPATGVRRQRS